MKIIIYTYLILLLTFFLNNSYAQHGRDSVNTNDSLSNILKVKKNDTLNVEMLTDIKTVDTLEGHSKKNLNWGNMPFIFDDLMIIGGINKSNIHYSQNYRELGDINGFNVGLEVYTPVWEKAYLHIGTQIARRGFTHTMHSVEFRTTHIDIPMFLSYELPPFPKYDIRLLIGSQFSFRTSTNQIGGYSTNSTNINDFHYKPDDFRDFDWGMTWGLSGEINKFTLRLRSYIGLTKVVRSDQGMNSAFMIEGGYFLFRGMRK